MGEKNDSLAATRPPSLRRGYIGGGAVQPLAHNNCGERPHGSEHNDVLVGNNQHRQPQQPEDRTCAQPAQPSPAKRTVLAVLAAVLTEKRWPIRRNSEKKIRGPFGKGGRVGHRV